MSNAMGMCFSIKAMEASSHAFLLCLCLMDVSFRVIPSLQSDFPVRMAKIILCLNINVVMT